MCEAYKRGVPVKAIAEEFGVLPPAIWQALRRGGALPPYKPSEPGKGGRPKSGGKPGYTANRMAISAAKIARQERNAPAVPIAQIVVSTPCFRCGVRADVGCKHNRGREASGS